MNPVDSSVESAIQRVQAGELEAYGQVVGAYQQRLRHLLAGLCPPGVDADEIAHRAFLEAFRQIDHYQLGTNFYAWLSVIARNLVRAELKRLQRQTKNTAAYLEHLLAQGMEEALDTEPGQDEQRVAALRGCQEQLSPVSQVLLRARYESQTPLEQVAQELGKSVSAIKFQLFAIRQKLLGCVRRKLAAEAAQRRTGRIAGAEPVN